MVKIPHSFLLASIVVLAAVTLWNVRKRAIYGISPVVPLLGSMLILGLTLLYFDKTFSAVLIFFAATIVAIIYLPFAWKDWVKVLKRKGVNPEEEIKLKDYFDWKLFVKLGYRHGVRKAAFLYALSFSATFFLSYAGFGMLLSIKHSLTAALISATIIFPVSYVLARKTIEEAISEE